MQTATLPDPFTPEQLNELLGILDARTCSQELVESLVRNSLNDIVVIQNENLKDLSTHHKEELEKQAQHHKEQLEKQSMFFSGVVLAVVLAVFVLINGNLQWGIAQHLPATAKTTEKIEQQLQCLESKLAALSNKVASPTLLDKTCH